MHRLHAASVSPWPVAVFLAAYFTMASPASAQQRSAASPQRYDLIIRNGRVLDGSGNPWFHADVGILNGRIAAVGHLAQAAAAKTIEARGLLVTPGFIDMHTHCDFGFRDPQLRGNEPWIRQGVTTVVLGLDGSGTWEPERAASPWLSTGLGTNVAFYVGHNNIRRRVMGITDRAPTPEEIEKMKALVKQGMENGAFGFSTGLEYIPGTYSSTEEVIELSKVSAQYGGIYDSHYRDEFHGFLESMDEGIEIAEKARIPVHLAHFKIIGVHNWWMMTEGLRRIREARARGLDITLDQYPWNNGATSSLEGLIQVPSSVQPLYEMKEKLPAGIAQTQTFAERERLMAAYRAELMKVLNDPATRAQLRNATEQGMPGANVPNWIHKWGYDWIRVVRSKKHPDYIGRVLTEIAVWRGVGVFDLMADFIISEGADLGVSIGPMSEENVAMAMKEPYMAFSSDGSLVRFGEGFPHPRSYGSFPRVYRKYVREEHVIQLEEAVRKMTSLPAQILKIPDRGRIAVGYWADITIFDPDTMADKATFAEPHQYSVGVKYVLVYGRKVLADGKMTGELPGKLLLKNR